MKHKKATVLAIVVAVVIIVGVIVVFTAAPKAADFGKILLGNGEFLYVSEGTAQPKTVSDVPALFDPDDDYMKIWDFAVQDLDGDGNAEVILSVQGISGDTGGNLILHQIGNKIYGYPAKNRDFMYLKSDGRFNYAEPSAVSEGSIGVIAGFTETDYTVDKITYSSMNTNQQNFMVGFANCVVDHQSASEEEFIAALNVHNEKPDAVWYDFTEENIKSIF